MTNQVTLDSQRNNLVRVIDDMVMRNGGHPYTCKALKAAQDHALKMEQEKSKVKWEKYEKEMLKKIDEIAQSNAQKNEAAIEERLEALAKSMAETKLEILWQNKEAYDRQLENLRAELYNAQAENTQLKQQNKSSRCTIS